MMNVSRRYTSKQPQLHIRETGTVGTVTCSAYAGIVGYRSNALKKRKRNRFQKQLKQ